MYTADTTVLSKDRYTCLFEHLEGSAELSRCLYNAVLFRIRQIFTGWMFAGCRMVLPRKKSESEISSKSRKSSMILFTHENKENKKSINN